MTLVLILALGICLRLLMLLSQKSLWGDEWFSISLAGDSLARVFVRAIQDVHPPLYFLALHAAVKGLGTAEWVFRLISFLASLGLLWAAYALGKEVFSKKVALSAVLLLALSPYALQSSHEIRSYSLLSFLTAGGTYFWIKSLRLPQEKRGGLLYGVFAVLSVYTEHYAWFWWLGLTAASAVKPQAGLLRRQGMILLVGIPALVLVVYQALFRENMFHGYRLNEYFSFFVLFKKVIGVFWHFTCGYVYSMLTPERIGHHLRHSPFFWVSALATTLALALLIAAAVSAWKEKRRACVYGLTALVLPTALLALFYPIRLEARYLSFAVPVFFLGVARGACLLKNNRVGAGLVGFLCLVSLAGSIHAIRLDTDPVHKEDYYHQVKYVFENARLKDAVCGLSDVVEYYRGRVGAPLKAAYFPNMDSLAASTLDRYDRLWFLNGVNMNRELSRRAFQEISRRIALLGFRPARDPVYFGGEEGITVVYLYERKN